MPTLRIALAQINSTVGDLEGNSAAIIEWTRRAADRGARLVVFPEMMLTGYPELQSGHRRPRMAVD